MAPGFVDLHTHLREPGQEYKEDISSGGRAAVAGGFTALCCMADTEPVNDDPSITEFILKRAQQVGLARVYPVGAVSVGLKGEEMAEIGEVVRAFSPVRGGDMAVTVCSAHHIDPEGERLCA